MDQLEALAILERVQSARRYSRLEPDPLDEECLPLEVRVEPVMHPWHVDDPQPRWVKARRVIQWSTQMVVPLTNQRMMTTGHIRPYQEVRVQQAIQIPPNEILGDFRWHLGAIQWVRTVRFMYDYRPPDKKEAILYKMYMEGIKQQEEEFYEQDSKDLHLAMNRLFRLPKWTRRNRVMRVHRGVKPYIYDPKVNRLGWARPQTFKDDTIWEECGTVTLPKVVNVLSVNYAPDCSGSNDKKEPVKRAMVNYKTNKQGDDDTELAKLPKFEMKRVPIWKRIFKTTDVDLYHYLKTEAAFLTKDRSMALILKLKAKRFLREFDMTNVTMEQQHKMIINAITLIMGEDNNHGVKFEDFPSRGRILRNGFIALMMAIRFRRCVYSGSYAHQLIQCIVSNRSTLLRIILGDTSDITTMCTDMATYIRSGVLVVANQFQPIAHVSTMSLQPYATDIFAMINQLPI